MMIGRVVHFVNEDGYEAFAGGIVPRDFPLRAKNICSTDAELYTSKLLRAAEGHHDTCGSLVKHLHTMAASLQGIRSNALVLMVDQPGNVDIQMMIPEWSLHLPGVATVNSLARAIQKQKG